MMSVRVLGNRLLIEPFRNSEINPGGAVYTGRATTTFTTEDGTVEQCCAGRVVTVGTGKRNKRGELIPVDVKEGDLVAFSDTCHRPAGVEDYVFIREDDVVGFLDKQPQTIEVNYR